MPDPSQAWMFPEDKEFSSESARRFKAQVLLDGKNELVFDYAIPSELASQASPGFRVLVPLKHKLTNGVILEILPHGSGDPNLKPIAKLLEPDPLLPGQLIQLARWMSQYYLVPLGSIIQAMLPSIVRQGDQSLERQQVLPVLSLSQEEALAKTRRAPQQAQLLTLIHQHPEGILVSELERQHSNARALIKALSQKNLVEVQAITVHRIPQQDEDFTPDSALKLSEEQGVALEFIKQRLNHMFEQPKADAPKPILLQGVTGSGKTEVYLQALEHVISQGGSAIVLVPEISLTPQTAGRFKARFHHVRERIALLHSSLSDGERHDEWRKIQRFEHGIVIGPRSAIFAPVKNLKLIIVDEEHEPSYKQENSPRYHARDVATVRAKLEKALVILGSATPSLESRRNVDLQKYERVQLTKRIDGCSLPLFRLVDMRMPHNSRSGAADESIISPKLKKAIKDRLEKQQQTILFLNRRGWSRALQCVAEDCGETLMCDHCSIAMTFHKVENRLICHLCGFQRLPPRTCPSCKQPSLKLIGFGTEKIERTLHRLFPEAKIARLDADTTRLKNQLRDTLRRFRARKIDILLGTQMIAKGLDFPGVTLVGVLQADLSLSIPDFRASERTFQLLTQVAGRAGRGELEGEVIVQTHSPHAEPIQFSKNGDFEGFYASECEYRQRYGYPPFTHVILIQTRSENPTLAQFVLESLHRWLSENPPPDTRITDPCPSALEKAEDFYRFQMTLFNPRIRPLLQHARAALKKLNPSSEVQIILDVDPVTVT